MVHLGAQDRMTENPLEWWGDGHTHSDWSDGFGSLQENARLFELYDEDFHFATDHLQIDVSRPEYRWEVDEWSRRLLRLHHGNLPAYEAACAEASSRQHLTIAGLELIWANAAEGSFGAPEGTHVLVREHLERLPEPAFFRGRTFVEILRELQAREMRPFLAHIHDGIPWSDLDGGEIAGLELRYDIECREPPTGRSALAHWDRWLSQGRRLALSAGSDCHQMDLWAAAATRNVLSAPERSAEGIRWAVREGHSYLSATWHPDLYLALGYTGIAPDRSGGFTPWWRLAEAETWLDRPATERRVEEIIAAGLHDNRGRVKRRSYPTLRFAIDGHGPGQVAEARDDSALALGIHMNAPLRWVRLVAQGEVVWLDEPAKGPQTYEAARRVSLRGRRYVRLEAFGSAGNGQDEYLLSNPIYLTLR